MNVSALKNLAPVAIVLAGLMGLSHPALAYSPVGVLTAGPGGTNFTVFGQSFPCTATFTINVATGGAATVVAASFGAPGSTACPFITANNLPWAIGPATLVSANVYQATISGISATIAPPGTPFLSTCIGSVTARFDQNTTPHRLTFMGILITSGPPASGQPCAFVTRSNEYLPTSLTAP